MNLTYNLKRIQDHLQSHRLAKKYREHLQWDQTQLAQFQKARLGALVRHAAIHSPFYKSLYRHVDTESFTLQDLPITGKSILLENFEAWVTDPRLKLKALEAHVSQLQKDEYYLGEYRILMSSGSSGLHGLFAYNRPEWNTIHASRLRSGSLGKSSKMALIVSTNPAHISCRSALTMNVFGSNFIFLSATTPIRELVAELNTAQPRAILGCSSVIALLAQEQLCGRLNLTLEDVGAGAELLTSEMKQQIEHAWKIKPFETYGMTESPSLGRECSQRNGVHIYEDLSIVEVVDENNCEVPNGTLGKKILLTNLYNFTQPMIRYEISDMLTLACNPCPCGQPFRRIQEISGRNEDVFYMSTAHGEKIPIAPATFRSILREFKSITQYQLTQEHEGVHLKAVVSPAVQEEPLSNQIQHMFYQKLTALGVQVPALYIAFVPTLEREKSGKFKAIRSNIS